MAPDSSEIRVSDQAPLPTMEEVRERKSTFNKEEDPVEIIEPLHDFVLILPDRDQDKETGAGLVVVKLQAEEPMRGTVLAVGEGRITETGELIPPPVQVGDAVIYAKFAGVDIESNGEELKLLRGDDVLAVRREKVARE